MAEEKVSNIWIVNQPYHLNDIELYSRKFPGKNRFICIEHRKISLESSRDVIFIDRFQSFGELLKNRKTITAAVSGFAIAKEDRIFIFNGQEIVNNIVLSDIYRKYSKNIIITDDGSSGYQFYIDPVEASKRIADLVKILLLKTVFNTDLKISKIGSLFYFTIHDKFVKRIIFPYHVKHKGNLTIDAIIPETLPHAEPDINSIIFLSQPFYLSDPGYTTYDDYIVLLRKILNKLTEKYSVVQFKAHPNDFETLEKDVSDYCSSVQIIARSVSFESMLTSDPSNFIYSFNSNGLLYSMRYGKTTVWLYNLISEQCSKDCNYLENIAGYNGGVIIKSFDQI